MDFTNYLRKHKKAYLILFALCMSIMAMQIVIPVGISNMASGLVHSDNMRILWVGVLLIGCVAIRFGAELLFGHLNYWLSNDMFIEAQGDYVQKYLRKEYREVYGKDFIYLAQRTNNDICLVMDYYVEQIPIAVCHGLKLLAIEVLFFYLNGALGVISLGCILSVVLIYFCTKKHLYELCKVKTEAFSNLVAYVGGRLSHILEIKIGARYDTVKTDFMMNGKSFVKATVPYLDFQNGISLLGGLLNTLFLILYLVVLRFSMDAACGRGVTELVLLSFFYFQQIVEDINICLHFGEKRQDYKVSSDRLQNALEIADDIDGEKVPEKIDSIVVEDVKFDYGDKSLLEKMNASFFKGNIYGIVGKNGGGKSTLILLLLGILKPQRGAVYWNGENITTINRTEMLKKKVAVTTQEPILLGKTLKECIFESQEICLPDSFSDLIPFIEEKGWNMKVKMNGANLSGGEKQKVALVNSLLKAPEVLILDEPTSAMDKQSIQILGGILMEQKVNKIILIVSHDQDILGYCDKVYDIEAGSFLEENSNIS